MFTEPQLSLKDTLRCTSANLDIVKRYKNKD